MSKIVLYRNARILEDKNMQVDDILNYLGTLSTPKTYNNAQLIKNVNDLDLTIKVNLDQDYMEKDVVNNYNYCSISNDTSNADTYFYFIRKINWKSKECLELVLHLDVLNTFKGEYKLTEKTEILREHQDRWEYEERLPDSSAVTRLTYNEITFTTSYNSLTNKTHFSSTSSTTSGLTYRSAQWTLNSITVFKIGMIIKFVNTSNITINYNVGGSITFSFDVDDNYSGATIVTPVGETLDCTCTFFDDAKYLQAKVDNVSEDFGDLSKQLRNENNLLEDNDEDSSHKWYLIYRTPVDIQTDSVVECILAPNFDYKIGTRTTADVTYNYSDLQDGYTYYFTYIDNPTGSTITCNGTTKQLITSPYLESGKVLAFCVYRNGNKLDVGYLQYSNLGTTPEELKFYSISNVATSFTVHDVEKMRVSDHAIDEEYITDLYKIQQYNAQQVGTTGDDVYAYKFENFNRTAENLIKIIELPYKPLALSASDILTGKCVINYSSGLITIPVTSELENQFKNNLDLNQYVPYLNQLAEYSNLYTASRFLKDPKLLHSDITQVKFTYDSYSNNIFLENCRLRSISSLPTTPEPYDLHVIYKQANTITSSLAFRFDANSFIEKYTSDYQNYIISTRNNEMNIYNNQYLNYMRVDYNYAKKAQQLQTVNNVVNTAVAGVGGAIAGAQSGGIAGAIVGGVTGTAKGLQTTITSSISSSNAIEQTIQNKKNAATGVSGSDDLNLFNFYGDNRLSIRVYQPKDYILEKIDDLFYYCGYKCFKQAVPDTTSRFWFNYIQCNPVYDTDSTKAKINKECLDELTNKYQNGVTVYHMNYLSGTKTWDFDQVKENWENALLND